MTKLSKNYNSQVNTLKENNCLSINNLVVLCIIIYYCFKVNIMLWSIFVVSTTRALAVTIIILFKVVLNYLTEFSFIWINLISVLTAFVEGARIGRRVSESSCLYSWVGILELYYVWLWWLMRVYSVFPCVTRV